MVLAVLKALPEICLGVGMLAITAVLFGQVAFRYVFGAPLIWSEELARVLLVWLVFLGAAVCVKRRGHFRVRIFGHAATAHRRTPLDRAVSVVIAAFSLVLIVEGSRSALAATAQSYMLLEISVGWTFLALPVSGALMFVYSAVEFFAAEKSEGAREGVAASSPEATTETL